MTTLSNGLVREGITLACITIAVGAAFWIGAGPDEAVPPVLALVALAALVLLGHSRSDAIRSMSGVGDERERSLHVRAMFLAGTAVSVVVPGWWLVTLAQGDPNQTLLVVTIMLGGTFGVASVILTARDGR